MKQKFYLFTLCYLFIFLRAYSQVVTPEVGKQILGCGFAQDSIIRQMTGEIINRMHAGKNGRKAQRSLAVYTIPVVVHVIEPGTGSSLVTDAQINAAIANLNDAYNGASFYSGSPDVDISFELANYDPSCNPTTGITRYDASGDSLYVARGVFNRGVSWAKVQSWVTWDKNQYLNIWIVNLMDNGAAGVGGPFTGLMELASAITGIHDYVTPHEVGHYFGVSHPFPDASGGCNCADGDGLSDTPDLMAYGIGAACVHESSCSPTTMAKINPCTGAAYGLIQKNIMNYIDYQCDRQFTNDQVTLMREVVETYYTSLLSSPALSTTPPAPEAKLDGVSTFCTAGNNFPVITASCSCSSIAAITINGTSVPAEGSLTYKPVLNVGGSVTWTYGLRCQNGLTASKTVSFYNVGVTNVQARCTSENTYAVSFENPQHYPFTASAGTVSGNSVINIANTQPLVLDVSDGLGCGNSIVVDVPCCALDMVTDASCIPTAANGLSNYFGIDNFTFGGINKSSSNSYNDGGNYLDRACTDQGTVSAESTYTMSVTGHYTNEHYVRVYIDYGNNGSFTEVLTGITPGGANNVLSGNILVPGSAVRNVPLRVRVLADYVQTSGSCSIDGFNTGRVMVNYGSGQVEDYAITIQAPLPVGLISFFAHREKNAVQLNWATAWEDQNVGFEIQRSTDAVRFERIGFVDAKQATSGSRNYLYTDSSLQPGARYYYRLRQMNQDQSFELSRIIDVKSWYESTNAYIYPNPVSSDLFTISVPGAGSYSVKMYSMEGVEFKVHTAERENPDELIISGYKGLAAGLYTLRMVSSTGLPERTIHVALNIK